MAYKNKCVVKSLDLADISSRLKVEFVDVKERYSPDEDLTCKFVLNNYERQECDRIAIFKMGWDSLKQYVLFVWTSDFDNDPPAVIFKKSDLPKNAQDSDDLYQFCYISFENVVYGVSTPFQICANSYESLLPTLPDSSEQTGKMQCLQDIIAAKDQEISKLRQDNYMLKSLLKSVADERNSHTVVNQDNEEFKRLKSMTDKVCSLFFVQQKQIDDMKAEIAKQKQQLKKVIRLTVPQSLSPVTKTSSSNSMDLHVFDLSDLKELPPFPISNCNEN